MKINQIGPKMDYLNNYLQEITLNNLIGGAIRAEDLSAVPAMVLPVCDGEL